MTAAISLTDALATIQEFRKRSTEIGQLALAVEALYREQNDEIVKLRQELGDLKFELKNTN